MILRIDYVSIFKIAGRKDFKFRGAFSVCAGSPQNSCSCKKRSSPVISHCGLTLGDFMPGLDQSGFQEIKSSTDPLFGRLDLERFGRCGNDHIDVGILNLVVRNRLETIVFVGLQSANGNRSNVLLIDSADFHCSVV